MYDAATPRSAAQASAKGGQRFAQTLKDARAGDLEAQYQLGLMLANGAGTRRDLTQALEWMTRAAERGHAAAQYMLGSHYGAEPGTVARGQIDEARALDWLVSAARQGHARAHHRLARLISQSHRHVAATHEALAAERGVPESQLAMGLALLEASDQPARRLEALGWLRLAAQQGLPAAQTALGRALLHGPDQPATEAEGWRWLQAAAAQAWPCALLLLHESGAECPALRRPPADPVDAQARHDLGQLWERGLAGLQASTTTATHWYQLAADQGCAAAHRALGRLCEQDDPARALQHYLQAAEAGDAEAMWALGCLLGQPDGPPGTDHDPVQAHAWCIRAAQAGHAGALLALASSCAETHPERTEAALRRAAEAGSAEAQWRLGQLSNTGDAVARQQAAHWFQMASRQGHVAALGALALAYYKGDGVPAHPALGLQLLTEAAERGDAASRWNLALLLAAGSDQRPRDLPGALLWCGQAAEAGFVPAQASMGVLCASAGRQEEAVQWWRRAASAGDVEAQYNLALALLHGRGVAADPTAAFDGLLQAAEGGLAQAQARLGVLYATGEGVVADPLEAHKWFFLARRGGDADAARNLERSRQLLPAAACAEAERRARAWREVRKPR